MENNEHFCVGDCGTEPYYMPSLTNNLTRNNRTMQSLETVEPFCVTGLGNCGNTNIIPNKFLADLYGAPSSANQGYMVNQPTESAPGMPPPGSEPFCAFGIGDCGGSTVSTSTVSTNQKLLNESDVKDLKEHLVKNIVNSAQTQANSCSQNINASQTVGNFKGTTVGGNFNISGVDMTQSVSANFSCVNIAHSMNHIVQNMSDKFSDIMSSKFNNNDNAKLNDASSVSATSQYLSAMPNVNSNTNVNYNLTVSNKLNKSMQSIFKTVMEKNLDAKQLQNCIANITSTQAVGDVSGGSIGGDADISNIKMADAVTALTDCTNKASTVNNTLAKLQTVVNTVIKEQLATTSKVAATETTTTASKGEGVFSIFTKIGGMFKSMESILIVLIIVGGIAAVIGGYFYLQKKGVK